MLLKGNKKSKYRPFLWLFVFVILVALAVGLLYTVFYSGLFEVQNFKFTYSNNYLKNSDTSGFFSNNFLISSLTAQIVKNKKSLGYFGSDNILFWLFGKGDDLVNRNVLPSVKEVDLNVDLINRQVRVAVSEKHLSGIICNPNNKCYAFDKEGRVFASAPRSEGSLILKINDKNDRPIVLGEKFLPREEWINNILNAVKIMKDNNVHIKSMSIRNLDLQEWELTIAAGPTFIFSLNFIPGDLEEVVQTLKERADFSRVNYFDMRVENRIYYK